MQRTTASKVTGSPWGPWATGALGILVLGIWLIVQMVVVAGFVLVQALRSPQADVEAIVRGLPTDGFLLALSTCGASVVCTGLVILLAWLREGNPPARYLALRPVPPVRLAGWLGITVVFMVLSDGLTLLLGRPIVPEIMVKAYETAVLPPLFWLAVVVAAPLFEEVLFRGFLLEGLGRSVLGPAGAVLITALVWAVIHLQYGAYEIATIFVLGILFGVARFRSGSLVTTLAMHSFFNLIATVQVVLHLASR